VWGAPDHSDTNVTEPASRATPPPIRSETQFDTNNLNFKLSRPLETKVDNFATIHNNKMPENGSGDRSQAENLTLNTDIPTLTRVRLFPAFAEVHVTDDVV